MQSILVIGLGRFGRHLAVKLAELGNEVLVVDKNEEIVEKIAPLVTQGQIADATNEEALRAIGARNFDLCFVCISDDFQSSLEITSLLKELGAKYVVSKADRDIHAKFLRKVGADDIVYPEREMAHRVALRFSSRGFFDIFPLGENHAFVEMEVPPRWINHSIADLDIRKHFKVNVIAYRREQEIYPVLTPSHVFKQGDLILLLGEVENTEALINLK
ncbi:MAG: TrkA family potassium uptake protein [Tissierellia bacterium]|nr:TrkA family potassium uptake protein [Bacillota bacterium]NLL22588.1 TrkA family potassium uptake protein [Tissierellia bacterium]